MKIIYLTDFLWFKKMIYLAQRYFVWIKQMLLNLNKPFVWIKKSLSNKLLSFFQLREEELSFDNITEQNKL